MRKGNFLKIAIALKFFFLLYLSQAQTCVDDYFAITYTSANTTSLYHSILTSSNEIVCTGYIDSTTSGVVSSDGWVAKFTANGTLLWSKRYAFPGYNYTVFSDLVQASDDSYWIVGEAYDAFGVGAIAGRITGILLHIDTYGNIIQSHAFDNSFRPVELTRFFGISKMKDGDFIIRGDVLLTGAIFVKLLLLRIDAKGNVKWTTRISSPNNSFAVGQTSSLLQENDKIVIGSFVLERDISTYQILKEGYFLATLDYGTGHLAWNKTYNYFTVQSGSGMLVSTGGIVHISSLMDGRLSFQTSFSDSTPYQQQPYTRRSVNMVTDASGNLLKAVAYYNTKPGCTTTDAYDDQGNSQVLLMDDGSKPLLVKADKEGTLQWQKAYGNISGNPVPSQLMVASAGGYYFFMEDRYDPRTKHLLKTDVATSIECAKGTVQMVTEDATRSLKIYESYIYPAYSDGTVYSLPGLPVYKRDYSLLSNIDCRKPCCTNVIDTASAINLCDISSYTLPNNDVVRESGIYYTAYKTSKGCDSIHFLPVRFLKRPVTMLGAHECLEGKDSVVLKVAGDFSSYNWMNAVNTDSTYTVKQPGIYWVEVENSCGIKRDSIEISEKCDFEIYMPNAFTPNSDGVNDNFGISPYNKNRFLKLQVFNRFGQIIFETNDINKKWDGSFKRVPQPVGIYLYYVEMENINGKKIAKRGIVTLIK